MTFKYPLVFLLLIPIFFLFYLQWRSRGKLSNSALYPLSYRGINWKEQSLNKSEALRQFLRAFILTLTVVALARPQVSMTQVRTQTRGIDIMLTLDVSKSMTIEDYGDINRLQLAQKTIRNFIKGRSDDRIGLVMFSGEAVTLCPPTLDYFVLERAIEQAQTDLLKDGTAIGEAIANSVNRLKESKAKSRIIILVTDGDSNMGAITPLTAGGLAQGYGIKVYTVALGKEGIVPMPVYEDFFGQVRKTYQQVNSSINPELLQRIAEETGGKFFRASEKGDLDAVFKEIDKLEKSVIEKKEKIHWSEEFQPWVLAAVAFLLLEFLLGKTFLRVLPN